MNEDINKNTPPIWLKRYILKIPFGKPHLFYIFLQSSVYVKRLNNDKSESKQQKPHKYRMHSSRINLFVLILFCLYLLLKSWQNYIFNAFFLYNHVWQIGTYTFNTAQKIPQNKKTLWLHSDYPSFIETIAWFGSVQTRGICTTSCWRF